MLCSLGLEHTNFSSENYLFSLDYLYPQTCFYRVEVLAKELCHDLDFILSNNQVLDDALQTNYLKDLYTKIYRAAEVLACNEQEAYNYLPEDITYLLDIVEHIHQKNLILITLIEVSEPQLATEFCAMVEDTKKALEKVLACNLEIKDC